MLPWSWQIASRFLPPSVRIKCEAQAAAVFSLVPPIAIS
jgi:hypothetical protein